jgi:hypothetical protein
MQRIIEVKWSPQEYASGRLEEQMPKPERCPNCDRNRSLEAHGYYWRWVNSVENAEKLLRIGVRRFFVAHAGAP